MGCSKLKTDNWRFVSAEWGVGDKNVVPLLDKQGEITAGYAYSPYGKLIIFECPGVAGGGCYKE